MGEIKENIGKWCQRMGALELDTWESLPTIPLYMDQVMSVLGNQLANFKRQEGDKLLTSTMINNYVRHEVVPHPLHKKYSKEQVAAISVIAMLKAVLSIQDLKTLLADCPDMQVFFESFRQTQQEALMQVCCELETALDQGENLKCLALRLSAESMARQAAAQQILLEIEAEAKSTRTKAKR